MLRPRSWKFPPDHACLLFLSVMRWTIEREELWRHDFQSLQLNSLVAWSSVKSFEFARFQSSQICWNRSRLTLVLRFEQIALKLDGRVRPGSVNLNRLQSPSANTLKMFITPTESIASASSDDELSLWWQLPIKYNRRAQSKFDLSSQEAHTFGAIADDHPVNHGDAFTNAGILMPLPTPSIFPMTAHNSSKSWRY